MTSPAAAQPQAVTLYVKPGCHLCEDAELLLEVLARDYPLQVTQVDITTDPVLFERYHHEIPVVVTNHGQIGGRIDARALRRLLSAGA